MKEIQINRDDVEDSPFAEAIVLERFYAGAGRGDVLARMQDAVASGVSLMVLSGGEGSGKTMMCRMLEHEIEDSTITIFFPHTVESFEDVVRKIFKRLGLQPPAADDKKNIDVAVERINAFLSQRAKGLLIIFDEAENIYLATLERIRKMLDRITAAGGRIHILFSGRKTFLENCEQLSLCDFRNSDDLHFDLSPLSEAETEEYLRICVEGLTNPDVQKIINDEVIRNIHSLAKGNFRTINVLANESLRSQGNDTSFMELLENVKDEVGAVADKIPPVMPLVKRFSPYLPWIGGALGALLLLFILFQSPADKSETKPDVPPSPADVAQGVGDRKEEPQPLAQAGSPEESPLPIQPEPATAPGSPGAVKEEGVGTAPEIELLDTTADAGKKGEEPTKIARKTPEEEEPAIAKAVAPPPSATPGKPAPVAAAKVVELRQTPPLKVKPAAQSEASAGTIKTPKTTESQPAVPATATLSVDQLFQRRLAAGSAWLTGIKDNLYTIQLMVLTSKNAEMNFKKMLAQPNYRQEAGNFYVFRRTTTPEVLVFYGVYQTNDKARLAQSNLPEFLDEHQPYTISIKGAVAKVVK